MLKKLLLATVAGVCMAGVAGAQSSGDTTLINEVIVTANRTAINRNDTPLSISVINRIQIDQSSESSLLPVLSQQVPGLFVTQNGITGYGLSTGGGTINIRGVGQGNKVLMMIDGQPQWAGLFGHSIPDFFVASDVERVEVVRGPASLIYGSNAMAGAVNVMTREGRPNEATLNARLMYGSHNTQKYALSSGYRQGRWSTLFSVDHDRTDGHRANSRFHITNGFGKVGYKINDHFNAVLNLSVAGFAGRNPGPVGDNPLLDNTYDALRGNSSLSLENKFGKAHGAVQLYYNFGSHKINDGYRPDSPVIAEQNSKAYMFRSHDHNYGVLAYESFSLFRRNLFTAGIDYKNWGGRAWNRFFADSHATDIPNSDKSVDEVAGYLLMQQGIGSKVNLNGGARYEHNSTFGGEWMPQAGITYNPIASNSIKFSASKGFRSPNIRELYMFMPANPDLQPESMWTYEVSAGQNFMGGKLFAEVTGFLLNAENMISPRYNPDLGRMQNINTGKFTNRGIEAEVDYRILKNLFFKANYSYLHLGKPIAAAPRNQFFASLTYNPGRFSINVNVQSIGDLYTYVNDDDPSQNQKECYTVLNARVAYAFPVGSQHMTVFVKGENLTNRSYSINYLYPMPGATVFVGVEVPLVLKRY